MNTNNVLNSQNFRLMLFLATLHTSALIVAPLLAVYTNNNIFLCLMIPSLVFTNTTWALIHEGIHSNFNSDTKRNSFYSRLLSLFLHSNFEVLRFGHLMHHRYNRTDYDLTEGCADKKEGQSNIRYQLYKLGQNSAYYFHITIGLYLAEVIGPILFLLPIKPIVNMAEQILGRDHGYIINGKNILLQAKRLKTVRLDSVINLLLFFIIIYLFSDFLWIYLLYLLIRSVLISSADNLPHYGSSRDKITGAFNLSAPKWWQKMILNFNLHRVHHEHPNLAWHLLPAKFAAEEGCYDQNYFKQYLRQWRGVVCKSKLV